MMTLKEKINRDFLIAFKERKTLIKNLLSVVKSEIQTAEKATSSTEDLSDENVTKILNKMAKSLNEIITLTNNEDAKKELYVIKSYLPKEMTEEEITLKVRELFDSGITNIGGIMKAFALLPADKKLVGEAVKEILK